MKIFSHQNSDRTFLWLQNQQHSGAAGNVLIYVVVLMLIFGALGVVMVSMFTSSTASTVTRNDTRRALYMAESGMRYAFSELRNNDFDQDVIDTLNTTTYTLNSPGSFTINVFGPWFESPSIQNINNGLLTLNVPEGKLPDDYAVPNNLWVINFEYTGFDTDETYMRSDISNYQKTGDTTLTFDVAGDFNVTEGDRVCLSVQPAFTQGPLNEGNDIVVDPIAKDFFPAFGGAININRVDYSYERLVEEGGQVKLKNISAANFQNVLPAFPLTVEKTTDAGGTYNGEFIVLSPRNHTVVPTGTSDMVSHGGDVEFGLNIYDYSLPRPVSRKPDITADDLTSNLSEQATDTRFFEVDTVEDQLTIGGGDANEFGSAFFDADMTIGGDQNYCQQGACRLALGIRTFFLFDFTSQGDGITFTLTNAADNSATSAGGDFQLSELMGYAGDSRRISNPDPGNPSDWNATNPDDRGLDSPKIAVEFDTRTNEPEFNFCAGVNLNPGTRNDPVPEGFDNKDVVQYVFWAREVLDLPCRSGSDNSTYDDNRHNADDWIAATGGDVRSSPAVGSDGTIYVGSDDGHLYAFDPDGTQQWRYPPFGSIGAVQSSPAVGADGTIYAGSNDFRVYAINPSGTLRWQFLTGSEVRSSPAIADDGTIYIGSDDGRMYAFDPTGAPKPGWPFNAGVPFSLGRPAIGPGGTIYVSDRVNTLYALNEDGTTKWTFNINDPNDYMPGVDPNTGTIYSDRSGNKLVAINPDGTMKWEFIMDSDLDSTPIVGPDGTIYFGTDDDAFALFALNPDGTEKWRFTTGDQVDTTPALSPDGSEVYVVSNDGNLYAVNTSDGEELWRFPITVNPIDQVANSSPAVGGDGTVYVGSTDNNLYAIGRPTEPRNIRDKLITHTKEEPKDIVAGQEVDVNSEIDWLNGDVSNQKRWAVRLEVDRIGADYSLSLWLRQCDDLDCTNILGTFFQDTRLDYEYSAVPDDLPMIQQFTLSAADNLKFERFFFGFTGAEGVDDLDVTISQFQLSFIRPGDPVISSDPDWLP